MRQRSFELQHEYLRAWLMELEKKHGKPLSRTELMQAFNVDLDDLRKLRPTWKQFMVPNFEGVINEEKITKIEEMGDKLIYGPIIYHPKTHLVQRTDTRHQSVLPVTRHIVFCPMIAFPEHLLPTDLIVSLLGYDPNNQASYQRGLNNSGSVMERVRKDIGDRRFAPDSNARVFDFVQKSPNGYFLKQISL